MYLLGAVNNRIRAYRYLPCRTSTPGSWCRLHRPVPDSSLTRGSEGLAPHSFCQKVINSLGPIKNNLMKQKPCTNVHVYRLVLNPPYTVDREIFVVKKISWLPQTTKILHTKFITQPIIASCL